MEAPWMTPVGLVLGIGSLVFILFVMVRSIVTEREKGQTLWRQFGLSIALCALFFSTWLAHGFSEWQRYASEQEEHGRPAEASGFVTEFSAATLENWQSEFLQLFAFVTLAALYIHKGSAESKDGEERIEASLRRLEEKMGTLPDDAPKKKAESWKLPDTPQKLMS